MHIIVMVPTLWTDIQHSFTYAVFILSFNILVSCNPEFMSFLRTFYWSTTIIKRYGSKVSPSKTPATMSKKSVSPSSEQTISLCFCKASL